ncbi:hypothetical protein SUGI_0622480 [Cryptomeria japonica]|nr:hypothetical protein SUGI_0622480 [Cryptomeria japonica]
MTCDGGVRYLSTALTCGAERQIRGGAGIEQTFDRSPIENVPRVCKFTRLIRTIYDAIVFREIFFVVEADLLQAPLSMVFKSSSL